MKMICLPLLGIFLCGASWVFVSSSFTPASVSGLYLWTSGNTAYTDVGCTTPAVSNGDVVKCWGDQSGLGNNGIGSIVLTDPTYVTNALNGLPVIQFSGTATELLQVAHVASLDVTNITWFVVLAVTGDSTGGDVNTVPFMKQSTLTSGNGVYFGVELSGGGVNPRAGNVEVRLSGTDTYANDPGSSFNLNTYYTFAGSYDGTTITVYKNGSSLATSTHVGSIDTSTGNLTIGGYDHSFNGVSFGKQKIAEIIAYNNDISSDNKTSVFNYLKTKYAHY